MDPKSLEESSYSSKEQSQIGWLFRKSWTGHDEFHGPGLLVFSPAVWKKENVFLCGVFDPHSGTATVFHGFPFETNSAAIEAAPSLAQTYRLSLFPEDPEADAELEGFKVLFDKRTSGATEH